MLFPNVVSHNLEDGYSLKMCFYCHRLPVWVWGPLFATNHRAEVAGGDAGHGDPKEMEAYGFLAGRSDLILPMKCTLTR